MRTSHYTYPVRLSKKQRNFLETMVHASRTPAKHYLVARVLLMSDQGTVNFGKDVGLHIPLATPWPFSPMTNVISIL